MPKSNPLLEEFVPKFYRRQAIDIMAFAFIDAYRFAYPSITIKEAATAFMNRYGITEDLCVLSTVIGTYARMNKELIDAERQKNKAESAGA